MSCPYFFPVSLEMPDRHPHDVMLPLGASWSGFCHAVPNPSCQPVDAVLRPCCNLGYARETCTSFPAGNGPDAVRFHIASDEGEYLRIAYVIERDHHPFSNGRLAYSRTREAFDSVPGSDTFGRQALAYVEAYLRRKVEAFTIPASSKH